MNNEIKEILDNFEKYEARYKLHNETQFIITHREIEPLLDYITNLQEENKRLKKENTILKENAEHNDKVVDKTRWNEMIYKSRCEKEIEYIHNHQLVFKLSSKKQIQDWFDMFYKDSLNILNGGKL